MPTYDVSALTTSFIEGASVFGKQVLAWDLRNRGIQVRTNVKAPQAMTKLSAQGSPRPYRINDDFTGAEFTDRVLTVYQSKLDMQLDPEDLRNTYLATLPEFPFEDFAVQQASAQFLEDINQSTLWTGVRNASGSTPAGIADGWGTIIAAEITATNLTPIVTGAITSSNAVAQVKKVVNGASIRMKKKGGRVKVSYDVFEKYAENYASLFGFQFNPDATGRYRINNTNFFLEPEDFMGTSQRIVATVDNNLVFGTDIDKVSMHPTPYLNYLKTRLLMPVGCQIQDLDEIVVNDQA